MIFDQLILHDFGIYAGRHEVTLTPPDTSQPIVLVGALNGRGKTTFFDAIGLALYGQRARLSNRGSLAWDEYLRRSINHQATGASIQLAFRVPEMLSERHYLITRSWESTGKGIREDFAVKIDGEVNLALAEEWSAHVESILPLDLAALHFFDGEKIDEFADPTMSSTVMRAAVTGLLGLGILDRLQADLKVLLQREEKAVIGDDASPQLVALEEELERVSNDRAAATMRSADLRGQLERVTRQVQSLSEEAELLGAERWKERSALDARKIAIIQERAELSEALLGHAAGGAPLRLVRDLLQRVADQVRTDAETVREQTVVEVLERRDHELLDLIEKPSAAITDYLQSDLDSRRATANRAIIHGPNGASIQQVADAFYDIDEAADFSDVIEALNALDTELIDLERALEMMPNEENVMPILSELATQTARRDQLASDLEASIDELERAANLVERTEATLTRTRSNLADELKRQLDLGRVRTYVERSLNTINAVGDDTIRRNLAAIEHAVLARFNQLIGKSELLGGIHLDPDTLRLSVTGTNHDPLPIERLSAGERQLLATAVLWGISTVAGRSIPLVIDTPLGRLDGTHRRNLVENYFPHAAPQVIVLSTDEEIDTDLIELLKPHIGHEYTIRFDDTRQGSVVDAGYFLEMSHGA